MKHTVKHFLFQKKIFFSKKNFQKFLKKSKKLGGQTLYLDRNRLSFTLVK